MTEASLAAQNEVKSGPRLAFLHVHSEYSITDGAIRIPALIKKVKAAGHDAVALTDFTNMFAAIDFYSKAKDAGIKAILGAEVLVKFPEEILSLLKPAKKTEDDDQAKSSTFFNLILLAKNNAGYKSLMKVVSLCYLSPAVNNLPVISWSDLSAVAHDLFAIDACVTGLISQMLLQNEDAELKAEKALELLKNLFNESAFLQLSFNEVPEQISLVPRLAHLARAHDFPLVAAPTALYLNEEDHEAHTVLTCVKNDLTLSAIRGRRQNARFHVLSDSEFLDSYRDYPDALSNIATITDNCKISLEFGKYFLPNYDTGNGQAIDESLRQLAYEGLEVRFESLRPLYGKSFGPEQETAYRDRLQFELDVIIKMGFPGYFLIVQDFINWAKRQGIPVGPGRGSGAGSLVAYALRITDLDPIPYNLIFERFLNPERVSMPDFDVDFCQDRRDEVIRYVTERYGAKNVAQITTFGKMKAKAALRDVGRVLEVSYGKVDRVAKLIPNELEITLKDAIEREPRIMQEAAKDPGINDMINIALQVEGLCRHTSVHAAGVVISEGGMENYVPVYVDPNGTLITQYEMKNAEKVGLIKFDFLGLKTLTVIDHTVKLIQKAGRQDFRIETIDLEDRDVYELMSSAHTTGVFQLEGGGMQALLLKLKPSRFEDVIAVVALFRPGPLGSGMVDDFIERKHGRQEITYPVPELEPILSETYGIILYQEQVQKIAAVLASYSLGEADLLRRAMGKKKPEEMAKQKSRFIDGARNNRIGDKVADDIFELMAKFADYGFNKSHSAAYGLVSYQTAFLKTHFPEYFMAAIMTCDLDNSDKLARYIQECRRLGFAVLSPHINRSGLYFEVPKPRAIDFGLAAIKGIGVGSLEPILEERAARGPFQNLTDLAKRVRLHRVGKKTLELLIMAGALDNFGKSRQYLLSIAGDMVRFSEETHTAKSAGARMLFDDVDDSSVTENQNLADWEIAPSARRVIDTLDTLLKEKKLLGAFISKHPLVYFQADVKRFGNIRLAEVSNKIGQKNVFMVALLNGVSERTTKSGRRMVYLDLDDESGQLECVMFQGDEPLQLPSTPVLVQVVASIQKAFDGSGVNVRIEKLTPLSELRRNLIRNAALELTLPEQRGEKNFAETDLIRSVHEIIQKHPGTTKLQVILNYGRAKVKLSAGQSIDLCEPLIQTFNQMSTEGVSFLYQQNFSASVEAH